MTADWIPTPYDYVLYIPATVFPGNAVNPSRLAVRRYMGIQLDLDGDAPFGLRKVIADGTMYEAATIASVRISADRYGPVQSADTPTVLFSGGLDVNPELLVEKDGRFSFDFDVAVAGGTQWILRGVKYRPPGSVYPGPPAPFRDEYHVYRARFSLPTFLGAGATLRPATANGLCETDYDADFVLCWIAAKTLATGQQYEELRLRLRDAEGRQLSNELIDIGYFGGEWIGPADTARIVEPYVIYPAGHPINLELFSFSPNELGPTTDLEIAFGGWKRYRR